MDVDTTKTITEVSVKYANGGYYGLRLIDEEGDKIVDVEFRDVGKWKT